MAPASSRLKPSVSGSVGNAGSCGCHRPTRQPGTEFDCEPPLHLPRPKDAIRAGDYLQSLGLCVAAAAFDVPVRFLACLIIIIQCGSAPPEAFLAEISASAPALVRVRPSAASEPRAAQTAQIALGAGFRCGQAVAVPRPCDPAVSPPQLRRVAARRRALPVPVRRAAAPRAPPFGDLLLRSPRAAAAGDPPLRVPFGGPHWREPAFPPPAASAAAPRAAPALASPPGPQWPLRPCRATGRQGCGQTELGQAPDSRRRLVPPPSLLGKVRGMRASRRFGTSSCYVLSLSNKTKISGVHLSSK